MSGKYAFTKTLKELRFLFCQTSSHSAAARFGQVHFILINAQTKNLPNQVVPYKSISHHEKEQPAYTNHA